MKVDPRDSVPQFLAQYKGETYVRGWAELWDRGDCLNWDKGFPNPALEDTLVQHRATLGGPIATNIANGERYRQKALVPGCGRGVDVLLLASFGYDAYGLECGQSAVEACRKEEARSSANYPARNREIGRGAITFVQGDFFEDGWLEELGLQRNSFDLIYDHSFFCALNPRLRPRWAQRQTELLAPSPFGHLVCLEYPRHKDPLELGPPFAASSEDYLKYLSYAGGEALDDVQRSPNGRGLLRVTHWQPGRTHATGIDSNGIVQDRISIWRRRG